MPAPNAAPTRRRAALLAALLAPALLTACGETDAGPGLEPGELLPGGATTNTLLGGRNAFIRPAENITVEHEPAFYTGNSFFNQAWVEAPASTGRRDGLGPLFNARSCAACHLRDGRGRPPESPDEPFLGLLLRLSVPGEDAVGGPLADPSYGGQLQPFAINDVAPEADASLTYVAVEGTYGDGSTYTLLEPTYHIDAPAYGPLPADLMVSPRVAPAVIGLGLLEAIPADALEAAADPDDADGDGISGRVNRVWDATAEAHVIGRFGWKGDAPSVRQQVAGAFLGDMGITTPLFTGQNCTEAQTDCLGARDGGEGGPEIDVETFEKVVIYTSLLAVPARREADAAEVVRGKALFGEMGCAACHTPSHRTGAHPLPEVEDQLIWPYTDLLLHDMGPALADDRPVFEASGQEWRTPPLWGIGLLPAVNDHQRLLHDGRARGVAEAILWHGGEAEASREAFRAAPAADRDAVVRFVESL